MSGPVSSAFISEAVSRITSLLTGKYSEHNNVQEWIDRLVMAQIQIGSALLESEEFDINNDEPLHKWQEKLKEALCEAEEVLSNFPAEILHEEPNQTIEGGYTASNLGEAVSPQVDLQANLSHDPLMQEEGSDDATLVHTASNLREAVTRQVDLQANLPHDPFMQEEGSDDATFVHPASNLREAVARQVDLQANLPHHPLMQEEGSDDATLVHPASNLTEAVTRQVDLQANLPHDQPMQEEGSDGATLVHPSLNLLKAVICRIELDTLQQRSRNLYYLFLSLFVQDGLQQLIRRLYKFILSLTVEKSSYFSDSPLQGIEGPALAIARALTWPWIIVTYSCKKWLREYLENDKNVSKLKNTIEKLEKMAGNIGNFIKLLELQKKRKMSRKRKRSGVALQGIFLVLSLKLQTYALFCYGEDTYLLVTKMFRANCTVPTAITGDIFIGFIM